MTIRAFIPLLCMMVLSARAAEIPKHVRGDIGLATLLLKSKHEALPIWPEELKLGGVLRCPNPINSAKDLKAVLATAPKTYFGGSEFGEVAESDGWFAASFDAPPGKSFWIHGVIVQKGSAELYLFSHW